MQGNPARVAKILPRSQILFSSFKGWLRGTFHGVSRKHLPRYLQEFVYCTNGHTYHLRFEHLLHGYPNAPAAPGHASGLLRLAFVPEPGTAALLGIGLTGATATGRDRRTRRAR